MADQAAAAAESGSHSAHRDVKAEFDERRIAKGVAVGLPLVTVTAALVAGATLGAPVAILILAAGILLGVIALFWASLRVLSGDAALPPELEALDATVNAVDALASRKKMLVRALKDLDNERALGKLEEEDYDQLSHTYRGELKETLARIDASLEPHRPKAEDAARAHLENAGFKEDGAPAKPKTATAREPAAQVNVEEAPETAEKAEAVAASARVACAKCTTSNETDATFCKKCGAPLAKADGNETKKATAEEATTDAKNAKKAEVGDEA
jgi:ribosomal protein L40E